MNKTVLLLVFFCIFSLVLLSCSGSVSSITNDIEGVVWEKISEGNNDYGYYVQQTSDGGYIVTGDKHSPGGGCWLIKTDAEGNELWSKTFGEIDCDAGYCVQQTSDGGYIIVGATELSGSEFSAGNKVAVGEEICLIKTDADGNETWLKTFGGDKWEVGYYVQQTSGGGYIIVGDTYSYGAGDWDIWLIKTDADGNELWNKTFGGEEFDVGYCVQKTSDGGYILVGATVSYGANLSDIWLIKTDADGNELWNNTFDRTELDSGNCVRQTTDDGYIVEGVTGSYYDNSRDIWLIKTDSDGNEIWDKTFGGADSDTGHCVQQTSDGGYIVIGETVVKEYLITDALLTKLSASGDISWQLKFGGPEYDTGSYVIQTTDGSYVTTGYTAERISGFSCENFDRQHYYHLFLIKLRHDD
jgi:hypothetical protein